MRQRLTFLRPSLLLNSCKFIFKTADFTRSSVTGLVGLKGLELEDANFLTLIITIQEIVVFKYLAQSGQVVLDEVVPVLRPNCILQSFPLDPYCVCTDAHVFKSVLSLHDFMIGNSLIRIWWFKVLVLASPLGLKGVNVCRQLAPRVPDAKS